MLEVDALTNAVTHTRKTLFILCGFPYAGKTFVAEVLQARTGIEHVSIDAVLYARGFDWNTNTLPNATEWQCLFDESYEMTKEILERGKNVLYDSTNQTVASRDVLRGVAASAGAETRVVYVRSSGETVWKRWEENRTNPTRSVVSRALVQMTIDMFEEPTPEEQVIIVEN